MYIDQQLQLRDDLPESLRRDFKILEEYYNANDWFMFDIYMSEVEASVKAHYIAGKISREELTRIFRKYGIV